MQQFLARAAARACPVPTSPIKQRADDANRRLVVEYKEDCFERLSCQFESREANQAVKYENQKPLYPDRFESRKD